jgi:hypothetical protein
MFLGTKVIQTVFVEILMFGEGEFVGNKSLLLARVHSRHLITFFPKFSLTNTHFLCKKQTCIKWAQAAVLIRIT